MLPGHVRRLWKLLLAASLLVSFAYLGYWTHDLQHGLRAPSTDLQPRRLRQNPVSVVVVLCARPGPANESAILVINGVSRYLRQLRVLIKSLLLAEAEHQRLQERGVDVDSEQETLELILFSDNAAIWEEVERFLGAELAPAYRRLLRLQFERVSYPKEFGHLKHLVHPCTTFRLFLDQALPTHDSVLYVDTDVIFWRHAGAVASEVSLFNESQWCGMGPDWYHELPDSVPFYGAQGLNAGVGVYNLSRMRASEFFGQMQGIYEKHEVKLRNGGDQGVLNIYFHDRPHEVRLLPCGANYIPLHCIKSPLCGGRLPRWSGATRGEVALLHGCWQAFFKNKPESQFSILFEEYEKLNMTSVLPDVSRSFRQQVRSRLEENQRRSPEPTSTSWYETGCTKNQHFLQNLFGDDS